MKKFKYKIIFKPNHPNANSNGQIPEHRYIMSEYLDRPLNKSEWVHHIDGNPLNNDIKNLQLTTDKEHPKIHLTGKPLLKEHCEKLSKSHIRQKAWNKGKKRYWKSNSFPKGNIPWNKGIKTGLIPKTAFKKGHKLGMTGKNHSEESKIKMSEKHKGKIPWNKKYHN